MAAKVGGHYGTTFQRQCGVTQRGPLSPKIINVVVDTVIRNWVTVVRDPQDGAGQEVLGTSIQALLALFYAKDGLVSSPESACLK